MKKILLLIFFSATIVSVTSIFAQSDEPVLERRMHIHSSGSVLQSIFVSNVDSITFSLDEVPPVVEIRDSSYLVNDVLFNMKAVFGGTFIMGGTSEQPQPDDSDWDSWFENERPTHNVTLSDYFVGETEVTQALWKAVMGVNPSYFRSSTNSAYAGRDNYPVETVSWEDIVCKSSSAEAYTINGVTFYQNGFCYKLSQLVGGGKKFRLPTEAEWEYAARGGSAAESQTKYSGSNNIDEVAWYLDNIPSQSDGTSDYGTQEIKTKQANALGLYDMSSNVYEWCSDWYGGYSSEAQTNPTGPVDGSYGRVLRGGSWYDLAGSCRVSYRYDNYPDYRHFIIGFRLAL